MTEQQVRILVIDDEQGIRKGCKRALEPEGYLVDEASSLQEGLAKIQTKHYEMTLLDVMLPDGRGIDILEPIHDINPEIICVIITGYATVELAIQAIKRGAYDFISKPFSADLLQMTVRRGLERRRLTIETNRLKAIEEKAAVLQREKENAERLNEFKSEFVLTVAHELRSPVGGAQSLLRTLVRGLAGELNEKQRFILGRVESRLDELLELINDLLSLAATQTIEKEEPLTPTSLHKVMQKVNERISPLAENKQLTLRIESSPDDLFVLATPDGLYKVILNLVNNAVKYTPNGGSITVSSANEANLPGHIKLSVSDTGIGIPNDEINNIWDDFFRASNAKSTDIQGTGLGLSIVKNLIEHFEGEIHVQSKPDQGTIFTVYLKNARADSQNMNQPVD